MTIRSVQGWSLIEKEETDSTNEDVKKLPPGSDKTAVCACIQTGGHGRMGRRWISPAGNLYVSLCLEKIPPAQAGIYSFLAAVGGFGKACEAIWQAVWIAVGRGQQQREKWFV